jgi:hypothetical protein
MFASFLTEFGLSLKPGPHSVYITREHESLDSFVLNFITRNDFSLPCIEEHSIREVFSSVWKAGNKSILLLIPEYIDIKIMERGTVGYMTSCRKKLVVLSISALSVHFQGI